MIPWPERLQDRARGGQAGAKRGRVFAPFERGQALLERRAGRIRAPRVTVAAQITAIPIALERGRQMDRCGDRARRRIDRVTGVHRQRFDPDFAIRLHGRPFLYCSRLAPSRRRENGDRAPLLQCLKTI